MATRQLAAGRGSLPGLIHMKEAWEAARRPAFFKGRGPAFGPDHPARQPLMQRMENIE
jgi:hypothetical protein